jgi:hypothetical protein
MKTTLITLTILFCFSIIGYGQKDEFLGKWMAYKSNLHPPNINGQLILFDENPPVDTITFDMSYFQQSSLVKDETKLFHWTQRGTYTIKRNKLILQDRVTSTGEPGKHYPDIEYKYQIKKEELILKTKYKLPDKEIYISLWTFYKRI